MKSTTLKTIGYIILQTSLAYAQDGGSSDAANPFALPPQSVLVDPASFAVLGENATFRVSSFVNFLNPTSSTPPFIQIFDKSFMSILGPNPSIHQVTANFTLPLAFEAPIYNAATDEVFFCSNNTGMINNQFSKISMKAVEAALAANPSAADVDVPITQLNLSEPIQIINGGTGPHKGSLILVTNGRGSRPPVLALVNPHSPNNVTVLLDNFFGRQFNSLDDVKVHPNGNFFFTDPIYGFIGHARPAPLMPSQVYRFDPVSSSVRVVVSDIATPNGIAFTANGKIAYVSDTGAIGVGGLDTTQPATIYAFDVDPETDMFMNRRTFAYTDSGIPDGIQVDLQGNVFAGCGDGVQVWNNKGTLLGKFFLGGNTANMVFAGDGRLVIMGGMRIVVAKIAAKGIPPISP